MCTRHCFDAYLEPVVKPLPFSECDKCGVIHADRRLSPWNPLGFGEFFCQDCIGEWKAENPPKFGGAW